MNKLEIPDKQLTIHCVRLGHQVGFDYCRKENSGLPCFRTIPCWEGFFAVAELLRSELSPEDWEKVSHSAPTPKFVQLFDLIARAKENAKK